MRSRSPRAGAALLPLLLTVAAGGARADEAAPRPRSGRYLALQRDLARGWNTWNTNSVLSHVLLPEGFAISLGLKPTWLGAKFLGEFLRGNNRPEQVKLGARTDDGSYTSLEVSYATIDLTIESAVEKTSDGDDLLLLIRARTPADRRPHLTIDGGVLWSRPGSVERQGDRLVARLPTRTITVGTTAPLVTDAHAPLRTPYLAVRLGEAAQATPEPQPDAKSVPVVTTVVGVWTGKPRTVAEIEAVLARNKEALAREHARWKELAEVFTAMQTVLAWNVIYDAERARVIAPVSRTWSVNFGGTVLFDWDTYFASVMFSLHAKGLAYANAVEITKSLTPGGFVPNFANAYGLASFDRSQPPVGSRIVKEIYRRYKERWLLEEVYEDLLRWNRWWPRARGNGAHLSWGTALIPVDDKQRPRAIQFAKFESGLDNAPMFDGVPFKAGTGVFELADVGLTSLYVMDCDALADIAKLLGKTADARELLARANQYRTALSGLWDEKAGIFLDRRTDTGASSRRLSPTHFYPLLARAARPAQAARMIKEHYFNPAEFHGTFVLPSISRDDPAFKDNNYWRGRIWAPMNYLVYLGLRNYDLGPARRDLVARSQALLLKSWRESRAVYENYNGATGVGGDVKNADSFYHWGALLGFIAFIERGDLAAPEAPLR
jgi:hypothetical protein